MAQGMLKPGDVEPNVGPFSFYVEAFKELSTCRPSGFGVSAIPFMAIVEYAKLYGIEGEEFHEFLYLIRAMDSELIKLSEKPSKPKTEKSENGGKTNTRNKGRN